jgi:hypothetical protein
MGKMKTRTLALLALVGLVGSYATPAYATTYFGPSFQVTTTSPGGPDYLTVSTASSSAYIAPPTGSTVCQSGQVCSYPLQSCTDPSDFYYSIHSITVTDSDKNQYILGSSAVAGMYWPTILGGPVPGPITLPLSDGVGNQGDALNVTIGDNFVLPFGSGAGGFTFSTSLGSPPETHAPEGPYYWWTAAGNVHGSNLRLDQNPGINPTTTPGTYLFDIQGVVVCGPGVFFDQGVQISFTFVGQTSHGVPEFSGPLAVTIAVGFVGLALVRRMNRTNITAQVA